MFSCELHMKLPFGIIENFIICGANWGTWLVILHLPLFFFSKRNTTDRISDDVELTDLSKHCGSWTCTCSCIYILSYVPTFGWQYSDVSECIFIHSGFCFYCHFSDHISSWNLRSYCYFDPFSTSLAEVVPPFQNLMLYGGNMICLSGFFHSFQP